MDNIPVFQIGDTGSYPVTRTLSKCSLCGEHKPDEDFSWKVVGVKRQYHCRACHASYRREHYLKNKEKYIKKAVAHTKSTRKAFFEWKSGQKCADCGNSDMRVLEFDHINGNKTGNIANLVGRVSGASLEEELAKCEVVCANCHRIRTATRGEHYKYLS